MSFLKSIAVLGVRQRDAHRARLVQTNYRAMESVPQVRVRELDASRARVDAHVHVDVALADFEQVGARRQVAGDGMRLGALDDDFGRKLDERVRIETARTCR